MSIFNFFKNKQQKAPSSPSVDHTAYARILDEIIKESFKKIDHYAFPSINSLSSYKELIKNSDTFLKGFLFHAANVVKTHKDEWIRERNKTHVYTEGSWQVIMKLVGQLLKSHLSLSVEELYVVVKDLNAARDQDYYRIDLPYNSIFDRITALITTVGLTQEIQEMLKLLAYKEKEYQYIEFTRINERIEFLLQGTPELGFNQGDSLGVALKTFIDQEINQSKRDAWLKLFRSCIGAASKTAPSQKWIADMKTQIEGIGSAFFSASVSKWINISKELIREIHRTRNGEFLKTENHDLLKGLIWCGGLTNNPELINAMDEYAVWAFKKFPGVGAISAKTGTACIYAFSMLPFKEGIGKIAKFKLKISNNTILKGIDKIIKEIAEKNGFTEDLVMELGIPDFGIDRNGVLRVPIGNFTAIYTIKGSSNTELSWESEGKIQKSVPAFVKNEKAEDLRKLKNVIKDIEALLPVQKDRIEQYYLQQKTWDFDTWKENYIDHPLVSIVAKKLIWHFANENRKTEGIFLNDTIIDVDKQVIDWLTADTKVQLWHPIGFSTDTILAWRNFLQQNEITQSFKQAYREIYVLTDAELRTNTYSNRFAAHILRQHQFAALCKQREWKYSLMGGWDSHNIPYRELAGWNIRAEYLVDAAWQGEMTGPGIFLHVATDQVRFFRGREPLQLIDIPALVFTEIMRDVDLFVGVTSIGNDSEWQDTGDQRMNTYWREYSFGDLSESAKIRSEVLKNLIPRLKIANVSSFDGKYLLVRGKLRNYKIHMGSGNILMSPNDQYLCIVPERSKNASSDKVFLPFEGDQMLSVILSKAILLAEDDKIKDETITRQINMK